jgi:hypothetical protein
MAHFMFFKLNCGLKNKIKIMKAGAFHKEKLPLIEFIRSFSVVVSPARQS